MPTHPPPLLPRADLRVWTLHVVSGPRLGAKPNLGFLMGSLLPSDAPVKVLDVTGHVPLCLVQHDDRTDRELTHLRPLLDLNRAACEVEPDCRHVLTRLSFDRTVEPHWQKLHAVRAALTQGCQHAVWLDTDAAVHTADPLLLLDAYADRAFFALPDPPPDLTLRFFAAGAAPTATVAPFNAGVWGVRNTQRGRDLINEWINLYPKDLWSVDRTRKNADCLLTRPGGPEIKKSGLQFRALTNLLAQRKQPQSQLAWAQPQPRGSPLQQPYETSPGAPMKVSRLMKLSLAAKSAAERALEATAARVAIASREAKSGCDEGVAEYAFHEKWRCFGSAACDT